MHDGHCSKRYPAQYITETHLCADSYPLYRRNSPDSDRQVSNINMRKGDSRVDQEIDNRWIIPYSKLLLRSMICYCSVIELCMSIKSIKYILKYVHKGCDVMFALYASQVDEITDYQNVNRNEAAWRVLEFSIQERDPPA